MTHVDELTYSLEDMSDSAETLDENNMWCEARVMRFASAEIKRLREELAGADEHAKRLEAVIEKMTVWEPSEEGRLG